MFQMQTTLSLITMSKNSSYESET